jgi:hypothetical protein
MAESARNGSRKGSQRGSQNGLESELDTAKEARQLNPDDEDMSPGTQPVVPQSGSAEAARPQATQALFRPDFDDDDDDLPHIRTNG